MKTRIIATLFTLLALTSATSAVAGEYIDKIKTPTGTKVKDNWVWDDWDVRASFHVVRKKKPAGTIYFKVKLVEADPVFDDNLGTVVIKVTPGMWTARSGGNFSVHLTPTFKNVSDYYGKDWKVRGKNVNEVPCDEADKLAKVSGGVDRYGQGYCYTYRVANDEDRVAMDPTALVTHVQIADHIVALNPPLQSGQVTRISIPDNRLPPADSENEIYSSMVQYRVYFADGTSVGGETLGPDDGDARLSFTGQETLGGRLDFHLTAQRDINCPYVLAASAGDFPGIPVDQRVIPLNVDTLMFASLLMPQMFQNFSGAIDPNGHGAATLPIPPMPELAGMRMTFAFVTLDPRAPSGLASISNPVAVEIQ